MCVAWKSGLRLWVSVVAAVALAVTAVALTAALAEAADARAASRELSQRLVPAAAASGMLLGQYTVQVNSLRDYVTSGRIAELQPFMREAGQIPGQQAAVARLVRGYWLMPGELAAAETAQNAWLTRVAGPQLAAVGRGDFARARALQANIPFTRPYTLAVRHRVADLQAQITERQGAVTDRLVAGQGRLFGALLAVCAVVAAIAVGAVVGVRRWLLTPFTALRGAADSVAAARYGTRVPAVGPRELADLGRSTELMRTRLVGALAKAERAEARFRGLFESSPDATLTVAADGSIVSVNAQAERMFGYSAGELAGQRVEILVPDGARLVHAAAADALRYASDLRQPIDLLLTDVIMPEMLGNEVAARVRSVRPTLAVLSCPDTPSGFLTTRALSTPMWTCWRSRSRKRCCSAAYARPLTAADWTTLPPRLTDFAGGGARRTGTLGARVDLRPTLPVLFMSGYTAGLIGRKTKAAEDVDLLE